jgi:hypothetical protein
MPAFIVLYGCEPEDFLNGDGDTPGSDAKKLAYQTHRYVHEELGNQIEAAAVVVNQEMHDRLVTAWEGDSGE